MRGSPFLAGSLGTPAKTLSQGALQLSIDGRDLLAVDRGSNQISVLRIKLDGSLDLVGDGPVSSNGVNPASIAVRGDLVYVANAGTPTSSGETNYTGFTLDPGGELRPLPGSTVTLPDGSRLTDVFFNSDGSKLIGTRASTSLIDSFTVVPMDCSLPPQARRLQHRVKGVRQRVPPHQLGAALRLQRTRRRRCGHCLRLHRQRRWHPGSDRRLTVPESPDRAFWIEITHEGQYLFVVNTDSKSISSYSIASDGLLTLLQTTPVNASTALPGDARLSPDGTTLWVVDAGGNTISGFTVDGGSLTELPTFPTSGPAGAQPIGIVVT
jgi:6-phosphogluconolactonase